MPCNWLPHAPATKTSQPWCCTLKLWARKKKKQNTSFCKLLFFFFFVRHFVTTMRKVIQTPRRDMNCPCHLLFLQCAIFCSPFRPLWYGTEKYQFSLSSYGPCRDITWVQGHRYLDGLKVRGPKSSPISTSVWPWANILRLPLYPSM